MGIQHLLLLLIYLDPLNVLCAATGKKSKNAPKRKVKEENSTVAPTEVPRKVTQLQTPVVVGDHDICLGYFDVSGQYDKEFECNNTDHRYCCGSCYLRFCCNEKAKRLNQKICRNYVTPDWMIKTPSPSPTPTGDTYDPELDRTNTTVYVTCGVIALIIAIGVSVKIAYDKVINPPQEMNVHRALADIMRQQGTAPIPQYEHESIAPIDNSPQENTPVRTLKNHYTPVHAKPNHGHYGKEAFLRSASQDPSNFLSSGFVTLGRGHLKAQHSVDELGMSWRDSLDVPMSYNNHQHDYGSHLDLTAHTPKIAHRIERYEKPRKNNILTSQTVPYDLSFSRSFQNLTHLPPSYELAITSDLSKYSSLKKLTDDVDEYYSRKRSHMPDVAPRGGLHTHMVKLSGEGPSQGGQQQQQPRQKPRRVQRAMSQDHVLSPVRAPLRKEYTLAPYSGGGGGGRPLSPYHGRMPSQEQLLSADRLHSQDPLLSPDKMLSLRRSNFREKGAMSRALSHADMLMPTTPVMDRHYKMTKMHSHPSASNNDHQHNLLTVTPTANKRQAFASRRTHTVDHLQYIPGHHHQGHHHNDHHHNDHHHNDHHHSIDYRTASKTEVTV